MTVTQQQVIEALSRVRGPDLNSNLVELGLVSEILVKDGSVSFAVTVPADRAAELEPLRQAAETVVSELPGVTKTTVVLTAERGPGQASPRAESARAESPRAESPRAESARVTAARASMAKAAPPAAAPSAARKPASSAVAGVRHIIAVASGKGGVGKSTVAVNLALGLKDIGLSVGIMDADIYGPSQPRLLGFTSRPQVKAGARLAPMTAYGLKAMSMGFMIDENQPVVWRGPMVASALTQMLRDVDWASGGQDLDVLIIDMPPGTGDVQLTLAQQAPLSGAVIVSTPQDLALIDARKGLAMFEKVEVPVLGIVENMSYFICPNCGERSEIFSHGGARHEAEKLGVPFLGAIPLAMDIRSASDAGQPVTAAAPDSANARVFREIADAVWRSIEDVKPSDVPELQPSPARDALAVSFADGKSYQFSAELLRVMSPSAEVQGHSPSQRVTVGQKRHVKIKELRPVGNYAVRIVFDDGHDTGLFSWTYLEELGRTQTERWNQYLQELEAKGLTRG